MKKRIKKEKPMKSLVKGPLFKRRKPLHYSSGYKVNKDIKQINTKLLFNFFNIEYSS